jgi:hypothetical protein
MNPECQQIRPLLDSFASNELTEELSRRVRGHLDSGCAECSVIFSNIVAARRFTAQAVKNQPVPVGLETRIQARLRAAAESPRQGWTAWALPAAGFAMLAVLTGITFQFYRAEQSRILAMLGIGRADHVECALGGYYPETPPTRAEMEEAVGPEYQQLVAEVAAKTPGFRIREGHRCHFADREFVHFILEKDGKLASLMLTRKKGGDGFPTHEVLASMKADGLPVYSAADGELAMAGFETGSHFAFMVSAYSQETNRQLLALFAPSVRRMPVTQ